MFDIITIGDATLDVFVEIDEASVLCTLEKENCVLCLSYADKIPVKKLTRVPGVGNAANVAVGSARLGLKTAIYTILGMDQTAKQICQTFKKEKVSQEYVVRDKKNKNSNYSVVINYRTERTILVFHETLAY